MCKANGKKINDWTRLKRSNDYIEALSTDTGIPVSALLVEIIGGGDGKGATFQGTFVHPEVAISISSWISPKFEVWANKVIRAVINNDFQALTPEAAKAQEKLQQIWNEVRQAGKATRRSLTDAIKEWYIRNPEGTSCPMHVMIALTTNLVYQALWSMDALALEKHLACDRHESRNNLDAESLKVLDRAEANVIDYIDLDNVKPKEAVSLANIRKARNQPSKV